MIKYKPKILHYTALNKGDLYLMDDGTVKHLIGTEILGTCTFLFKSLEENDSTIQLNYPGLGKGPHAILNMSDIFSNVDKELKEIRHQKIQDEKEKALQIFKE